MSKFHSTVSRRDFMKVLGLAGAGLGAAAATTPVFHDLDEVAAAPGAQWKRDWWTKGRDIGDPTVEIDWSVVENRVDLRKYNIFPRNVAPFNTYPGNVYNRDNYDEIVAARIHSVNPDWTGDTVRDKALASASRPFSAPRGYSSTQYEAFFGSGKTLWMGPQSGGPPEVKWQGTPEENLSMLRQAGRFFGAMDVGCVELDANTRKLIWGYDWAMSGGKKYEFEDVDTGYETATKKVIPNKCKYMIVWTQVQGTETTLRAPSALAGAAASTSYQRIPIMFSQLQQFLWALGYQGVGGHTLELSPSNPFGVLSGVGEHARMTLIVVSPEYGSLLRGVNRILTDLPLAPTKPIDAGIYKFCETCKICAEEACPFDALPKGDPSWEADYSPQIDYPAHGFKGYRMNTHMCFMCRGCMSACPFNTTKDSWVHALVGATVATTPLFNGFFTSMEKTFNYGMKDPYSYWDVKQEPVFGISTKFTSHLND